MDDVLFSSSNDPSYDPSVGVSLRLLRESVSYLLSAHRHSPFDHGMVGVFTIFASFATQTRPLLIEFRLCLHVWNKAFTPDAAVQWRVFALPAFASFAR